MISKFIALFSALSVNWLLSVPLTAEILKPWAISLQKLTSKGYIHLRDYFERIHEVLEKIESCQSSVADLEEAAQEILKGMFFHSVNSNF